MSAVRMTRAHRLWIIGQAGLVLCGALVYFRIRVLTAGSEQVAIAHAHDLVRVERWLHLPSERTLQRPVASSATLATIANWVYIWGHWPVIITTMLWLARRHSDRFLQLRDGMMISGVLGMVVFATFPVAPPRLAGLGLVDTVTERSRSYRVLQPPSLADRYAAMPSLHAGWDLLVGLAIVGAAAPLAVRAVGYLLPVLMAVAVVVTANHYLLDVVAGQSVALIGHAGALALARRRRRLGLTHHGAPEVVPRPEPGRAVDGPGTGPGGDASATRPPAEASAG